MPPANKIDDVELQITENKPPSLEDKEWLETQAAESKQPAYTPVGSAKSISAASLYSLCSVSMILVNKSLASRYGLLLSP